MLSVPVNFFLDFKFLTNSVPVNFFLDFKFLTNYFWQQGIKKWRSKIG